ncbi:glycoside hydrolase family 113 [Pontibacter sp. H249]|uniref:glycoside hydrolase family 113 n=1 Tax=Pontibacter sp. H249 TaxID=3133420 RepID=UPI0030C2ADED
MKKRLFIPLFIILLILFLVGAALVPVAFVTEEEVAPVNKFRGVSWVAGDSVKLEQLAMLKRYHVTWIAQTPFGWQTAYNEPEIRLERGNKVYWGERDSGLIHTTQLAKQVGLKTLLKPHIWLMDRSSGKWLGDVEMQTEEEWQEWFTNYSNFILHYARLAQEQNIDALCIGTELYLSAVKREEDWRKLIKEIRKVYKGQLTYAANWYKEYEEIRFWDELDFIGIQAYFPLTTNTEPRVEELQQGWKGHFAAIASLQAKYKKPVVFTEIGYKSTPDAAIEPWKWPDREWQLLQLSEQTQANAYEAMFRQFWQQPWFGGTFIWKWYPKLRENRRDHLDFTPQNKAAGEVMAKWYGA